MLAPEACIRCVVHASVIQSERDIFRFSQDLSMVVVRSSSIVTEYRTIQDRFAGAPDRFFDFSDTRAGRLLKNLTMNTRSRYNRDFGLVQFLKILFHLRCSELALPDTQKSFAPIFCSHR